MAHKSTYRARNLKALIRRHEEQTLAALLTQYQSDQRHLSDLQLEHVREAQERVRAALAERERHARLTPWQKFREYFAI